MLSHRPMRCSARNAAALGLAAIPVWGTYPPTFSLTVDIPVSLPGNDTVWYMRWNASDEPAETCTSRFRAELRGFGVFGHFSLTGKVKHSIGLAEQYAYAPHTLERGFKITWDDLPGYLHSLVANSRPDIALQVESAPYDLYDGTDVGVFVLQSPGHQFWQVTLIAFRVAFQDNLLPRLAIHVLVHAVQDWRPRKWQTALGEAWHLLGGFHWCDGYNRYPTFNAKLMQTRLTDNYWNKIFLMVQISMVNGYKYLVSLDDDVVLNPSTVAALVNSGPRSEAQGCGVVVPLTQNGIPSTELFADTWLKPSDRRKLYDCFASSSRYFCSMQCCSKAQYDKAHVQTRMDPPSPWNPVAWYKQVGIAVEAEKRHLHPVRGNLTCMQMALDMALDTFSSAWLKYDTHNLIVDQQRIFPHLCNNAFLMRTDYYLQTIRRRDIDARTDEFTMNQIIREGEKPMCFLGKSFGIHPAWGSHGMDTKIEMECHALLTMTQHLHTLVDDGRRALERSRLSKKIKRCLAA